MQPVQLSLMPEQYPAPPSRVITDLPVPRVEAAVVLLARLIAKAAAGDSVGAEAGGE